MNQLHPVKTLAIHLLYLLITATTVIGCKNRERNNSVPDNSNDTSTAGQLYKKYHLDKINLPAGFKIEVYAEAPSARSLCVSPEGTVFVGTDDIPGDELNTAPATGMNFGYPYCHQGNIPDPEFGRGKNCNDYTPPAKILGAHVAALGMRSYKTVLCW